MSKMALTTYLAITAFAVWALMTGWSPEIHYERITWGLFAAWMMLLHLWFAVRARVLGPGGVLRRPLVLLIDILFSLLPGVFLFGYGWLAPAAPTLTRGGMDVCDLEVGYCVSGTRAFIGFGLVLLVFGSIFSLCLVVAERAAAQARRKKGTES